MKVEDFDGSIVEGDRDFDEERFEVNVTSLIEFEKVIVRIDTESDVGKPLSDEWSETVETLLIHGRLSFLGE